jgi:hypothetical protein
LARHSKQGPPSSRYTHTVQDRDHSCLCNDVQADALITSVVSQHGRVDGVTNCVGSIVLKSAHTTSDADFDEVRLLPLQSKCSTT